MCFNDSLESEFGNKVIFFFKPPFSQVAVCSAFARELFCDLRIPGIPRFSSLLFLSFTLIDIPQEIQFVGNLNKQKKVEGAVPSCPGSLQSVNEKLQ
jgi:hypothetical protein